MINKVWNSEITNTYRYIIPIQLIMVIVQGVSLMFYGQDPKGINNYVFLLELNSVTIISIYYGTRDNVIKTRLIYVAIVYLVCINFLLTAIDFVHYSISLPVSLLQLIPLLFLSGGKRAGFWFHFYFIVWIAISIIPVIGFVMGCLGLVLKLFNIII